MTARITIERVLRDDNDASGQSVRDWFVIDLNQARELADDLAKEAKA